MAEQTKEQKRVSVKEVRGTISTSLATAFGFVIGLLWNSVVMGGLNVAGVNPTLATEPTISSWAVYLVTAIVLTVVLVVLIIVISRWGSK
jgi:ABC-type tungstate transport system substrate-binding protein